MLRAVLASDHDYGFIRKGIMLGARNGHFKFSVEDPEDVCFVEQSIRSAIRIHRFVSGLQVLPVVFKQQHRRVGMVMMSEVSPGQGGNEIHIAFVSDKYRGMGLGGQMIDFVLEQRQDVDVLARCAPVSQRMYDMLVRRGFEYQYTGEDGLRVLLRPQQLSLTG